MFKVIEHGEVLQFAMGLECARLVFNAYLIDGLLVNTGPARFGKRMAAACSSRKIDQIVNTGGGPGCIGNNARLQREFSLPIRAHRQALPMIRQPQGNLVMTLGERLWWGMPVPSKVRRINTWINTPRCRLRVIPVLESGQGQICLYEEEKGWLFSGELLSNGNPELSGSVLEGLQVNQVFTARLGIVSDLKTLIDHHVPLTPAGGLTDGFNRQNQAG